MKSYELTYLVSSELNPEQMETLLKKINSLILKNGEIMGSIPPDKKNLAYPIKKQDVVFLNQIEFNFEPDKINDFKKEIQKEKEIIRIMLTEKKNIKIKKKSRNPILEPKPILKDIEEKEIKQTKQKANLEEIGEKLDEILN